MKTGVHEIDSSEARYIYASDEVGYGSWAGRLYVAAVVVPRDWNPPSGLTDSKAMSDTAMRRVADSFLALPLWPATGARHWYCIEYLESTSVDEMGVYHAVHSLHHVALQKARQAALEMGGGETPLGVVDGNLSVENTISLPKADVLVPACSMASVLAKVTRDVYMKEMDILYPGYDFASNAGYRSPAHEAGLKRLGPCPIHRRSYAPIADMIRDASEQREAWLALDMEDPDPRG